MSDVSEWKYVNRPVIIGMTSDGQASLLFQVLPPGDTRPDQTENVAKMVLPLPLLRQFHEFLGDALRQLDRMQADRISKLNSAGSLADEALRKVTGDANDAG